MNASWIVRHGTSLHPQLSIAVPHSFDCDEVEVEVEVEEGDEYTVYSDADGVNADEGG